VYHARSTLHALLTSAGITLFGTSLDLVLRGGDILVANSWQEWQDGQADIDASHYIGNDVVGVLEHFDRLIDWLIAAYWSHCLQLRRLLTLAQTLEDLPGTIVAAIATSSVILVTS
jgi:hypothetical protein